VEQDRGESTPGPPSSEDRQADLARIVEQSPNEIYVFHRESLRFIDVNRAGRENLGYTLAELRSLTPLDLKPEFTLEGFRTLLAPLQEGDEDQIVFEARHRRKDASTYWADVRLQSGSYAGQPVFVAMIVDGTERRRVEVELRRTATLLESVLDSTPDHIFVKDLDLRTTLCNRSFARALGKAPEDLIGHTDVENGWDPLLVRGDPAQGIRGFESDDRRALAGYPVHNPCGPANVHGEVRYFDTVKTPMRDDQGEVVGLLGVARDVTERKRAEDNRLELERQFQHVQKLESLGVLAGGIAHDFNNLLTSILGYADLARIDLPTGSQVAGYIEQVVAGARQAASLTQQMLAYSGKGRFVVEPLCLSREVQDMTRLLEISITKKCVLKYEFFPDLPSIDADQAQIRQIIMNLVLNASDAIGEASGMIAISTGAMACDRKYLSETYLDESLEEGLYVFLEVSDNGSGMDKATRRRIFDPFFTTKFTGRGLGLAAVLGIVRGHRGAIRVYSEEKRGTTFKVLFPASNQPTASTSTSEATATEEWRSSGTVLVVDDEESVRGLASAMLERMGFQVLLAGDGREGVEVFRSEAERLRLVLLDMAMPHLNGEEAFRAMRQLHNVRTILCSGYNEQAATNRFAGKGLAGFLQKPYRYEQLQATVRTALGE
jgi:two-component system, cell cycle sensor histidine kinase and response regulator CckA